MTKRNRTLPTRAHAVQSTREDLRASIVRVRRQIRYKKLELARLESLWVAAAPQYECVRCGYQWKSRVEGKPICCARCHSRGWETPRKVLRPAAGNARKRSAPAPAPAPAAAAATLTLDELNELTRPGVLKVAEPPSLIDINDIGRAAEKAMDELVRDAIGLPAGLPPPPRISAVITTPNITPRWLPEPPRVYYPPARAEEPQPESRMPQPPPPPLAPPPPLPSSIASIPATVFTEMELRFPPLAPEVDAEITAMEDRARAPVSEED